MIVPNKKDDVVMMIVNINEDIMIILLKVISV